MPQLRVTQRAGRLKVERVVVRAVTDQPEVPVPPVGQSQRHGASPLHLKALPNLQQSSAFVFSQGSWPRRSTAHAGPSTDRLVTPTGLPPLQRLRAPPEGFYLTHHPV